jgi:NTP pyrophosphatase (non-canonical NTP hydrolase)
MNNQTLSMTGLLRKAITLSADPRGLLKTSQSSFLKLVEEVGELAEAILIEDGLLPHKPRQKEPAMGEAADVILMVIQTLHNHYPKLDASAILDDLQYHLGLKLTKWEEKVLSFNDEDTGE